MIIELKSMQVLNGWFILMVTVADVDMEKKEIISLDYKFSIDGKNFLDKNNEKELKLYKLIRNQVNEEVSKRKIFEQIS